MVRATQLTGVVGLAMLVLGGCDVAQSARRDFNRFVADGPLSSRPARAPATVTAARPAATPVADPKASAAGTSPPPDKPVAAAAPLNLVGQSESDIRAASDRLRARRIARRARSGDTGAGNVPWTFPSIPTSRPDSSPPLPTRSGAMTTQTGESNSVSPSSSPMANPADTTEQSRPIRLIFVDDDDLYREALVAELAEFGFAVTPFADGAAMLEHMATGAGADVIVLDWNLPGLSGIDLLPKLRRRGVVVPVVFLTGRSAPVYENMAFDRGAIDFVDDAPPIPLRLKVIVDRPSARRPWRPTKACNAAA